MPPSHAIAEEILAGLEMSKRGLRVWFRKQRQFCVDHGGNRYGELLALLERYEALLERDTSREAKE